MKPIIGADKLSNVFGVWPAFHDAEVWSLCYDRTPSGFSVVMLIHVFKMTSEVDSTSHYVLANHSRVRIRFNDCLATDLARFNHQNVLFELQITEPAGEIMDCAHEVQLHTSYGLEGNIWCQEIVVEEVDSWIPPFGIYAGKPDIRFPPTSG